MIYSHGEKALIITKRFLYKIDGLSNSERIRIASEAFSLAFYLKEPWVYYQFGKSMENGQLGLPNQVAADASFQAGVKELQVRAQKGDSNATFWYAYLLGEGLGGLEKDLAASKDLIKTVASELPPDAIYQVVSDALWGTGIFSDRDYIYGLNIIDMAPTNILPKILFYLDMFCSYTSSGRVEYGSCILNRIEPIESLGNKEVLKKIARARENIGHQNLISRNEPKQKSSSASRDDETKKAISDSEAQDRTGYLKGAPRLAQSGLSTFKINNTQGSADAIARIYLNGAKPAVRSMYVKRGENFTAQTLPPGTYTLRYRFARSPATFEATNPFVLEEEKTETGTRFSTVTVTLYPVSNGNMQTKEVSPDDF